VNATTTANITTELTLPCGTRLPNRIAKAAMSEQLASIHGTPSESLIKLYAAWAHGGAGLLITGNAMVDRRHLTEPRNTILEDDRHLEQFARWARAGKAQGGTVIMQISHPGRVATAPLHHRPVGPSALRPGVPGMNLRKPHALTTDEIHDLISRFARTAELAVQAGFDGVQVHAAHGYLLSQFLSPVANQRTDEYGGSAANRRRMLLETVTAVRSVIGPDKVLSVKLNSADFQKGGLSHEESLDVAVALGEAGIDLLEISGGNYEAPAMTGVVKNSTASREAYFLRYAEELRRLSRVPLMLTGGVRSHEFMNEVLASGAVDVIGMGRPLAIDAAYPAKLLAGEPAVDFPNAPRLGIKEADAWLQLAWHGANFKRIAAGSDKPVSTGLVRSLVHAGISVGLKTVTQP
jgi:2,4-dienoyl-CoA reductase-like NADH-dependent reductase (Old Yellow Enzyme family)